MHILCRELNFSGLNVNCPGVGLCSETNRQLIAVDKRLCTSSSHRVNVHRGVELSEL